MGWKCPECDWVFTEEHEINEFCPGCGKNTELKDGKVEIVEPDTKLSGFPRPTRGVKEDMTCPHCGKEVDIPEIPGACQECGGRVEFLLCCFTCNFDDPDVNFRYNNEKYCNVCGSELGFKLVKE